VTNKYGNSQIPKVDISLLFEELAFGLDDQQYRALIMVIDLFHSNLKKQKVRHIFILVHTHVKMSYSINSI
jgi:vacuolar protein sorting-associated protein 13A/C